MKDVLGEIKTFSQKIVDAYRALEEEATDSAIQAGLHQVINNERELIESLDTYLKEAPDKVLNVWFQSPGLRQLREGVKEAENTRADTIDDIVDLVVHVDDLLKSIYKNLASNALSREVQEIFTHLHEVRSQQERNFVWQSSRENENNHGG